MVIYNDARLMHIYFEVTERVKNAYFINDYTLNAFLFVNNENKVYKILINLGALLPKTSLNIDYISFVSSI